MKTVYAPDTANAYLDAARDLAASNPIIAYALVVAAAALFATWAARNL